MPNLLLIPLLTDDIPPPSELRNKGADHSLVKRRLGMKKADSALVLGHSGQDH
jgi:hypothetical protein